MSKNFVFIGDSLTFGYGINKSNCWVNKLKQSLNYNIINKGTNGSTTADMLMRFNEDVLSFKPNLVFIMGGTNDLLSNRTVNSIIDNIDLMLNDLINNNIDILIGLPPYIVKEDANKLFMPTLTYNYCEKSLPLLRDKLISLCEKYNCKYIDFYSLTIDNIYKNIYIDGIHLNELGHTLMYNKFINDASIKQ